jgi:acyl-CoA hydrolase
MFSDGVIDLFNSGIITNNYKIKHPGKIAASFVIGTKKLYESINDNQALRFIKLHVLMILR